MVFIYWVLRVLFRSLHIISTENTLLYHYLQIRGKAILHK